MNLRKGCCTNRVLMMVLHQKFIMFFSLSQCVDKLRIPSVFISPILLLQYSIHKKHGRKSFLNLIIIHWFFLTKLQLRANLMNNMIVTCLKSCKRK
jgi:hypothetical protein